LRFRQRNQAISKTKATAVFVYKDKDDMITTMILCALLYILAAIAAIGSAKGHWSLTAEADTACATVSTADI
jgi:hypothetical protein